ncbi:MAG TPA: hypothetical protein VIT45_04760 [Allosphingosinicella sp.]
MRFLFLALCLLIGLESVASACSCRRSPRDEASRQALAARIAKESTALVEVELVSPYDPRTGRGERLRVRRVLAGRAGPTVEVERLRRPQGAACDIVFHATGRRVVALQPALHPEKGRPLHRVGGSCTAILLADPATRQAVIAAIRRRR